MIVGLLSGTISSFAQEYQKAAKAEISKKGEPITFDKTTHNFGDLVKGVPATATFTITNNKTEPLVLVHVGTSCGCTVPVFTKEPIAPGKTGEIKLKYDSRKMGYFKKSAQVKTKEGKFFSLFIDGTVKVEGKEGKTEDGRRKKG